MKLKPLPHKIESLNLELLSKRFFIINFSPLVFRISLLGFCIYIFPHILSFLQLHTVFRQFYNSVLYYLDILCTVYFTLNTDRTVNRNKNWTVYLTGK